MHFSTEKPPKSDKEEATETETATGTATEGDDETKEKEAKSDSLRDTVNRLKGEEQGDSSSDSDHRTNEIVDKFMTSFQSFSSSVSETWQELVESEKPKDINKKVADIHESAPGKSEDDDNEAADNYEGTTAIMIIDEEENMNAFERIQKRLSEAPIINDILGKLDDVTAAPREKMAHVKEDAQEAWETSQNPWVYRASSVYDTLTAESEDGMAERELRNLDPNFSLETWKRDVAEVTLPNIMQQFLEGKIKELKPMLGESVYKRLAAEARVRKKEGVYVDTNVLAINNVDIVACTADHVNKGSPVITVSFMCQQINCVRKKETNEIVEGSEDDIKAYIYVAAFQREYDEDNKALNWKIVDFMLNGAIAYL